ncbi:MAG: hypothetical protein K9I85_11165 [Saprospiraceae bacterium]|nr:hypothetical protein [Saprospiraceae bacterium]
MTIQTRFLIFASVLFCSVLTSCQQDVVETSDETTVTEAPPKLQKTGPETGFQVMNAEGQIVHNVKFFEAASLASGTVYQFSNGEGQMNFESGPTYKLRAPGYRDIAFKVDGVDRLTRIIFYMWSDQAPAEGLSLSGQARANNFIPFKGVSVICNDEVMTTEKDGTYTLTPPSVESATDVKLAFNWQVTKMETSSLVFTLLDKPDFPIRLDVFLQTDTVLQPKQKALN